jgi:hypothetical protein
MSHVKSVICYNGGAGGDFLKALCLTQFSTQLFFTVNDTGMVCFSQPHFFKDQCELYFKNPFDWTTIDQSQIQPVDNTHYYFDWFSNIFQKIYYIDYPDSMTNVIFNTFINKRHQGNKEQFINIAWSNFSDHWKKVITRSNVLLAVEKNWTNNQRRWRNTPNMHAINLIDLFDLSKIKMIVSEVIQNDLNNLDQFEQVHSCWVEQNQNLLQAWL